MEKNKTVGVLYFGFVLYEVYKIQTEFTKNNLKKSRVAIENYFLYMWAAN